MEDYGGTPPLVCILPLFLERKMFLPFLFVGKENVQIVHCTQNWSHPFPHQYFGWILLVARVVDQRTAQHHIIFVDTLYLHIPDNLRIKRPLPYIEAIYHLNLPCSLARYPAEANLYQGAIIST